MNASLILAQATPPHQDGPPAAFIALFAAWILLGAGGWFIIWRARTAERKRQIHRWFVITAGAIFFLFVCASVVGGFPATVLFMAVPAITLITWLNLRFTNFCDGCNRMIYNQIWWRRIRFCPHCGVPLAKPL